MTLSKTVRRRGEGYTEYVILTSILMICALVGMLALTSSAKMVALERHLCVSCPAHLPIEELYAKKAEYTGDPDKIEELAAINAEIDYRAERRRRAVKALSDSDLLAKEAEFNELATARTSDQDATLETIGEEKATRPSLAEHRELAYRAERRREAAEAMTRAALDEKAAELMALATRTSDEELTLAALREEAAKRDGVVEETPTTTSESNPYVYDYEDYEDENDWLGIGSIGRWFSNTFRLPSGAPMFYDFWESLNFWA